MSNKFITLTNIVQISGLTTGFNTCNISNKQLFKFYDNISQILKELDPQINYEGKISKRFYDHAQPLIPFFSSYDIVCKSLQVKDDKTNVRTHQILYHKIPQPIDELIRKRNEYNLYTKYFTDKPNIQLISTDPNIYKPIQLIEQLKKLDYVDTNSFNGFVFNLNEIRDIESGVSKNKGITQTGNVLTLYSK